MSLGPDARATSSRSAAGVASFRSPAYDHMLTHPALGATAAHATGDHVAGPYRFEVLHGVSHWVPEQAPDRLAALLLEHLR